MFTKYNLTAQLFFLLVLFQIIKKFLLPKFQHVSNTISGINIFYTYVRNP